MEFQAARHQHMKDEDARPHAALDADSLADALHMETDALQELEASGQGSGCALQFNDADVERYFQLSQEQNGFLTARWGAAASVLALVALHADCWTREHFVNSNALMFAVAGSTLGLGVAWCVVLTRWRRRGDHGGKLQRVLLLLAVFTILLVLSTPACSSRDTRDTNDSTMGAGSSSSSPFDSSADREQLLPPSSLSDLALVQLTTLTLAATSWGMQFPVFCAVAAFSAVGTACWFAAAAPEGEWRVLALFLAAVVLLGVAVYQRERQARGQFLRLRRMLLEIAKRGRQIGSLQLQVSAHVDTLGVAGDRRRRDSLGNASTPTNSSRSNSLGSPMAAVRPPAALGESWMENVLRTLVTLKRTLGEQRAGDAVRQLEFVIEALTGEHDLFLADGGVRLPASPNRRRSLGSNSTPHLDSIDAGGWLSLLSADPRRRRGGADKTSASPKCGALQRQATFPPAAVSVSLRRAGSGFLQSVLVQVESYLSVDAPSPRRVSPRHASLSVRQDEWSAAGLLRRAATSDELDLFALADACAFPLSALLLTTVESHSLFLLLPLRVESTAAFAREIERRYRPKNPYHNALHAASVVWDVNFFLRRLERPALSALQLLSALLAAAVHDVNHPGVNNAYLVATNSPLAIKYSDDSVLERMHLAECFQVCAQDGCDVFEALPRDQKRQSRQLIIAMVLATDLSGHVQHVNRLKSKCYALQAAGEQAAAVPVDLALTSVIMMADLGHAFKSFEAHRTWSQRVTDEFFSQGDVEREFHLPVSPLCDRQRAAGKFESSQIGFLEFIVLPLYLAVRDVVPLRQFDLVLAQIRRNAGEWRQRASLQDVAADVPATCTELREPAMV